MLVAGRGFGKSGVEIGEGETGAREMAPRMCGHLGPFVLERRGSTIEPPAPQKRC